MLARMNLIRSYQHYHLTHDPFPFMPQCHQDNPYFQSWVVNHGELTPDLQTLPPGCAEFDGAASPGARAAVPRKERRRTASINTAFAELRERIPNVPPDTKLSKIKTLRLATSYIAYLMDVLAKDSGGAEGFKAEIKKFDSSDLKRKRELNEAWPESLGNEKKLRGRTGWPQQVWAFELNA